MDDRYLGSIFSGHLTGVIIGYYPTLASAPAADGGLVEQRGEADVARGLGAT